MARPCATAHARCASSAWGKLIAPRIYSALVTCARQLVSRTKTARRSGCCATSASGCASPQEVAAALGATAAAARKAALERRAAAAVPRGMAGRLAAEAAEAVACRAAGSATSGTIAVVLRAPAVTTTAPAGRAARQAARRCTTTAALTPTLAPQALAALTTCAKRGARSVVTSVGADRVVRSPAAAWRSLASAPAPISARLARQLPCAGPTAVSRPPAGSPPPAFPQGTALPPARQDMSARRATTVTGSRASAGAGLVLATARSAIPSRTRRPSPASPLGCAAQTSSAPASGAWLRE